MIETVEIKAGGFRFRADCAGPESAPVVILLHGFPQSRNSWRSQITALANAGFRCIAPDQRGYSPGARPEGIEDYHVDLIVQDVLNLADAVGAERFHLVGHDWGGQIAWLTAIAAPGRLLSLTVLSRPHPAAFARAMTEDAKQAGRSGHHKRFQDPAMAEILLANGAESLRNSLTFENAKGVFAQGGSGMKRRMSDKQAKEHLAVLCDPGALDAALNWYRAAFAGGSTLARTDVPKIKVPTLYVWGNEDGTVGRIAAEGTADFVDAAYRFLEVNGAGHFLAEETPDAVNSALLEHLESVNG